MCLDAGYESQKVKGRRIHDTFKYRMVNRVTEMTTQEALVT